jgi:hypothetical protein
MNFTAVRRIGVGDRERVRAGLLQVLCLTPDSINEQIEESLIAAKKLKRTLRIYFNADLLDKKQLNHIVMVVMGRARDHDVMEMKSVDENKFDWILNRCDIVLVPSDSDQPLHKSIIDAWGNGRELGAYNLPFEVLKERFPQFYGQEEEFWKAFKQL